MAVIVKHPREVRIEQAEARGLTEAVLAGPASGCNRFSIRRITIKTDGRTARTLPERGLVYFVHSGSVTLSHGQGELDHLEAGEAAVVHPGEAHHLQNIHSSSSIILAVVPQ